MIDGTSSAADRTAVINLNALAEAASEARNKPQPAGASAPGEPAPGAAGLRTDEVVLSEAAMAAYRSGDDAPFNQARVEAIKKAIETGNYPLDARRIAESFVTLERLIGGPGAA